jgi:PKD repeat protein
MVVYDEWSINNSLNRPVPPTASFSANPISGQESLTVQFIDQSTGDITRREWRFSDSTPTTGPELIFTHTFNTAGNYTVTLTVYGSDGIGNTQSTSIVVTAPPGPIPPR